MIDSFFQHRGVSADTHDSADSDKFPCLVCLFVYFRCMYGGIVLLFWMFVLCCWGKVYSASIQSVKQNFFSLKQIFNLRSSFRTSEMLTMHIICPKCCRIKNIARKQFVFLPKTPLLRTSTLMDWRSCPRNIFLTTNFKHHLELDQAVLCLTSGRWFHSCLFYRYFINVNSQILVNEMA